MINKKFSKSTEAAQIKDRIENWRKNKATKTMPEALWLEAVSQAQQYNPSAVAKYLNIGHADLIKRIPRYRTQKRQMKNSRSHGFVELPQLEEVQATHRMEMQVTSSDGQSVIVRGVSSAADWENVFTGWLKASRASQGGKVQ